MTSFDLEIKISKTEKYIELASQRYLKNIALTVQSYSACKWLSNIMNLQVELLAFLRLQDKI